MINQLHSNGRITFKEWLRYVREWTENVAKHYGTTEDIERIRKVSGLTLSMPKRLKLPVEDPETLVSIHPGHQNAHCAQLGIRA